jgi:hypothetical protein
MDNRSIYSRSVRWGNLCIAGAAELVLSARRQRACDQGTREVATVGDLEPWRGGTYSTSYVYIPRLHG